MMLCSLISSYYKLLQYRCHGMENLVEGRIETIKGTLSVVEERILYMGFALLYFL